MLVTPTDNPVPKVGQLFYKEYCGEDGKFEFASLCFIDEEPKDNQWMYSQIAIMEDAGSGMKVYGGFEAGGMPTQYTRITTDEDILKFIRLFKNNQTADGAPDFKTWLEEIENDSILLDEEKKRIVKLSSDQLGQDAK